MKYDTSLNFIGWNEIDFLCSFSPSLKLILSSTSQSIGKNTLCSFAVKYLNSKKSNLSS